MNLSIAGLRSLSVASLVAVLVGVLPGCSKKSEPVAMNAGAFDSAPPELRAEWKAASEFAAKNNYMGTATNLMDLLDKAQQLSPEQGQALETAWQQLGNKAFAAANAGDKMATDAVLKMRDSKFGGRRGGR
jgi:hypothetical protein